MRWAIAAALVGLAACYDAPDPAPAEVVRGYFDAVAQRDCEAMARLSGGKVEANLERLGCDALLASYQEMELALVSVERIEADGRDRDAQIVRAMVTVDGKPAQEVLLRVEREGGQWVLVSL